MTGCNIYGKAEYFNPGESVKDRAALFIVEDAIKRKLISKGGTIVEGTAGNTGIGLAIVCWNFNNIGYLYLNFWQSLKQLMFLKITTYVNKRSKNLANKDFLVWMNGTASFFQP